MAGKEKKTNRILLIVIIAVVVIAGAIFAVALSGEGQEQQPQAGQEEESYTVYGDETLGIDAGVDEALKDYRNIFIFGTDNKDRSDIILLASINRNTNQVKLITVYRDTYMQLNRLSESRETQIEK